MFTNLFENHQREPTVHFMCFSCVLCNAEVFPENLLNYVMAMNLNDLGPSLIKPGQVAASRFERLMVGTDVHGSVVRLLCTA